MYHIYSLLWWFHYNFYRHFHSQFSFSLSLWGACMRVCVCESLFLVKLKYTRKQVYMILLKIMIVEKQKKKQYNNNILWYSYTHISTFVQILNEEKYQQRKSENRENIIWCVVQWVDLLLHTPTHTHTHTHSHISISICSYEFYVRYTLTHTHTQYMQQMKYWC